MVQRNKKLISTGFCHRCNKKLLVPSWFYCRECDKYRKNGLPPREMSAKKRKYYMEIAAQTYLTPKDETQKPVQ